jgi:hypothetical protein
MCHYDELYQWSHALFFYEQQDVNLFAFSFQLQGIYGDWEEFIDDVMITFEKQHKRKLAYSISFY